MIKVLYVLKTEVFFLKIDNPKFLIVSLIQFHFDYACSFWHVALSEDLKNKLQVTPPPTKKKSYALSLTWIQGYMWAQTFLSLWLFTCFKKS